MKSNYIYLFSIIVISAMFITTIHATPSTTSKTTDTANITQSKREDIKKLLTLMESKKLGKQVLMQMIQQFKQMQPKVPNTFWNQFVNDKSMDSLIDLTIPIYAKHLSHEDIHYIHLNPL